jgi:hypothetical protein
VPEHVPFHADASLGEFVDDGNNDSDQADEQFTDDVQA